MKEESLTSGIVAVMKYFIDVCNESKSPNKKENSVGETIDKESGVVVMEKLPHDELYIIIKQHKSNMEFLKENNIMADNRKLKVVENIEYIFQIIEGRSTESNRKMNHDDSVSSNSISRKVSN